MRVVTISPGYPPDLGGVETVVQQTSDALAYAGHEVEVWTQGREMAAAKTERTEAGVLVRRFPGRGTRRFPFSASLARYARWHGSTADVVHAHNYHALAAATSLLLPEQTPVVLSAHYHGGGHSPLAKLLHIPYGRVGRRMVDRADAVVAVSEAEADLVRRNFPEVEQRISVVHNGCEADRISDAAPLTDESRPVVLSLGRLEEYKRVERALLAFAELDARGRLPGGARLVVIGEGPDGDRLRALVPERVKGRVTFLGALAREHVLRWLRTAHVVISMSDHEAFGVVALEAAAAGAIAVLSDIPAHREVAGLTPVGAVRLAHTSGDDTDDPLLDELERALSEPRHPVASVRTWDEVAEGYEQIYRRVLRDHGLQSRAG